MFSLAKSLELLVYCTAYGWFWFYFVLLFCFLLFSFVLFLVSSLSLNRPFHRIFPRNHRNSDEVLYHESLVSKHEVSG